MNQKLTAILKYLIKPAFFGSTVVACISVLVLPACSNVDAGAIDRIESRLLPLVSTEDRLGIRSSIGERMLHYGVPGVSVAVLRDGNIEWAKGYGSARPNESVLVTTSTVFQAASISKSVAAVGALRLVQDGVLNLDEDVNEKLESWRVPSNSFTEERDVILRDLLGHTAGITVHGFPGYSRDTALPTLVEILDGLAPANTQRIEVNTPIGDTWRYSGGGYTIIQQLVVDVTRQPFQEFMTDNVLVPLGMTNSTFELPLDKALEKDVAWGNRPGLGPVVGGYQKYPESAAAGLWSTPTDLAKFAIGVHKAATGHSTSIINEDLAKDMLTANIGNYGYGFMIAGDGSSRRFRHTGINEGFDSMYVAYAESGTGAVVMTNSNLSSGLISEIVGSIAEEYGWLDYPIHEQRRTSPFSTEQLIEYPGTYVVEEGFEVTVERKGDSLFMSFPKQGHTEVFTDRSNNSLFVTGFPFPSFQLVLDETGRQIHFPSLGE